MPSARPLLMPKQTVRDIRLPHARAHLHLQKDGKNTFEGEGYSGLRIRPCLHWRHHLTRKSLNRLHNPSYQQLQAPGTVVLKHRSCRLLGPQPFASTPIPYVPARKLAVSNSLLIRCQPLPVLRRTADGGLMYPEQDSPGDAADKP